MKRYTGWDSDLRFTGPTSETYVHVGSTRSAHVATHADREETGLTQVANQARTHTAGCLRGPSH